MPKSNMGGKCYSAFSSLGFYKKMYYFNSTFFHQNILKWIVDSGANQHMVMSNDNMFNLVNVSEYNISVKHPNGTDAKVKQIRCFRLSEDVILKDVFVVPKFV
ncbi:hypothetical protein HanRHA438_Chr17g0812551 [Helianthus annuus]|nr:hypothetical protein HanRHA438_Chr17g0812551 [Helianthus annuus]